MKKLHKIHIISLLNYRNMKYYSKQTLFKFHDMFYLISTILYILIIIIYFYNLIMNI